MAIHLLLVRPAKADRTKAPCAVRESEAVGFPIDQAPCAISGFAVIVPIILDEGEDFEIDRPASEMPCLAMLARSFSASNSIGNELYLRSGPAAIKRAVTGSSIHKGTPWHLTFCHL
jgi:hypothetical protein